MSSSQEPLVDAIDFVISQQRQGCVKIVKVDVRSSDSFVGNRNLDLTDSNKKRVTLCFVGLENEAFLLRHFAKLTVGACIDVGELVPNLKVALQIRKMSFVFWMAENGAHFYFGPDVVASDKNRLIAAGKKDVEGKFF